MAILSSLVGCDQATKHVATNTLKNSPPQSYLADTVRFDYEGRKKFGLRKAGRQEEREVRA